jgi:hypothetical protein
VVFYPVLVEGCGMRGLWVWSSDSKEQETIVRKVAQEDELGAILTALAKSPDGLSNAQIDRVLRNNSQWRTLWHMRELIALGIAEYKPDFFGDPGRYVLTERGRILVPRMAD